MSIEGRIKWNVHEYVLYCWKISIISNRTNLHITSSLFETSSVSAKENQWQ